MAQANNNFSKQTSVFWACKALKEGRAISHKDEMDEIGAWRLGAIIHRLKREFEWPISVEYRGPEKVAYYSLGDLKDGQELRLPRSASALGTDDGGAE